MDSVEGFPAQLTDATEDLILDVGGLADADAREVLIHHVDLSLGFGPGCWPDGFVAEMIPLVVHALNERGPAPLRARLQAADTGEHFFLGGNATDAVRIGGRRAGLLAWLLGRADGSRLASDTIGPLPPVPSRYYT